MENRIIIEWGKGALAWVQNLKNMAVLEVLPKGYLRPPFKDYLEFTLAHAELKYLFKHADHNNEWRSRLSAVAGIYLILATHSGHQYIGSAYGAEGIWGRWGQYAQDGHGGNVQLRKLVEQEQLYPTGFSYSILQVLPKTLARDEVIGWERRYKANLGTLATGLNSN